MTDASDQPQKPLDARLGDLGDHEIGILFYKCQGLTHTAIANRLGLSFETVNTYSSRMLRELGFPKGMNKSDRAKKLQQEICPQLKKYGPTLDEIKANLHTQPSTPETDEDRTSPYWLMVLEDNAEDEGKKGEEQKGQEPGSGIQKYPPRPLRLPGHQEERRRFPGWLFIILLAGFVLAAYELGRWSAPGKTLIVTATSVPVTLRPSVVITLTPEATASPIPTASPTATTAITPSATPTATISPTPSVYGIGNTAADSRVSLQLLSRALSPDYYGLSHLWWAIDYNFRFTNQTTDQIELRFNRFQFVVHDNIGRKYECYIWPPNQDDINLVLSAGQKYDFAARCGYQSRFDNQVTSAVLSISGQFSSLGPTQWQAEVPH